MKSVHVGRIYSTLSIILAVFATSMTAQTTFEIRGTIKDASTRLPLIGATIHIFGSNNGDISSENGTYQLKSITQKQGVLIVNYLGFTTDSIPYDMGSQQILEKNIWMKPNSITISGIEVKGKFGGAGKALNDQKTASNIKNVVSIEQMIKFPDLNAAESIGRIPGITLQRDQGEARFVQIRGTPPELSNFNINGEQIPSPEGDVRYVGLDVVPIDQLASIEISKALTPDQDGDAIGGAINLVTKTARDTTAEVHATLATGYNNLSKKPQYNLQFGFGQRFKQFGFYGNASFLEDNRASHNMEFNFNESRFGGDTAFRIHYDDVQLRHYEIKRKRTGLSGAWDFKPNDRHQISLNTLYNRFSDDEQRRRVRYNIGNGFLTSETTSREADIERDLRDREKIQTITSINLNGKHNWNTWNLDYLLGYSKAEENTPDRFDINFNNDLVNLGIDLSEQNWPRITFPRPKDSATVVNWADYEFSEMLIQRSKTTDQNLTARMNLEKKYEMGRANGSIKMGWKARLKNKVRDVEGKVYHKYFQVFAVNSPFDSIRQIYSTVGPEFTLASVNSGFDETNLLNRDYMLGATPDVQLSREFADFYAQNFKLQESDTKEESLSEDYIADENIYAAYGMFTHYWGRCMLLGGLRYERTDIDYEGKDVQFKAFSDAFDRVDTLRSRKQYAFWLPQFHFKYSPTDQINYRAALTWTYSRPNFEDILPYRQSELDSREITLGNPDLQFATAINADLLAEKYLPRGGLISGGVFYKRINNFIYYFEQRTRVENISRPGWYFVTSAQNGLQADVYGAEMSWNQQFYRLPGIWKYFGVYFNYTYTYSKAIIQNRNQQQETINLPGQSPNAVNLALIFDHPKLYIKATANFNDRFLDELGIKKSWDVYYDRTLIFDFNMNYNLNRHIQFYMNAVNLSNAPLKYYLGNQSRVKLQEFYSWQARAGVRINL